MNQEANKIWVWRDGLHLKLEIISVSFTIDSWCSPSVLGWWHLVGWEALSPGRDLGRGTIFGQFRQGPSGTLEPEKNDP